MVIAGGLKYLDNERLVKIRNGEGRVLIRLRYERG